MSKFSGPNTTTKPAAKKVAKGPLKTKANAPVARTHNMGTGYTKGDKTALFTLAVTNMVGEATFYESGPGRDSRFIELVRKVAVKDPAWMAGFIPFLRDTANMRSASVVAAVESARALSDAAARGESVGVTGRQLINAACSRADEPAEVLGYWMSHYGRSIPAGVKRGIADAASKLYNERSALKYDGADRGIRMGDVIELTHPKPSAPWQDALFGHLLDRRHGHVEAIPETLTMIAANNELKNVPVEQRRALLKSRGHQALAEAGYTWEQLSGWLPGGMDDEAWEAIIPSMGYMALLRNLSNFEKNGVSREVVRSICARLTDPEEVARSRQFPYRILTAYKALGGVHFASALEDALDLSCKNIPALPGRTLVMVDTSGSMTMGSISTRSVIRPYEIAGLFGAAIAARGNDVKLVGYDTRCQDIPVMPSVLKTCEEVRKRAKGGGTLTWPCTQQAWQAYGPLDRICVLTDAQDHPSRATLPRDVPIYVWDILGYGKSNINTNEPGRYLFGGFSDACFRLIPLLEAGQSAAWPWIQE